MVRKMSGVKVVEEEKVAETSDVQKTMESMINLDGASWSSRPRSAISTRTC